VEGEPPHSWPLRSRPGITGIFIYKKIKFILIILKTNIFACSSDIKYIYQKEMFKRKCCYKTGKRFPILLSLTPEEYA
jgi:hypothetical protein